MLRNMISQNLYLKINIKSYRVFLYSHKIQLYIILLLISIINETDFYYVTCIIHSYDANVYYNQVPINH